jgi:hypothetical protein
LGERLIIWNFYAFSEFDIASAALVRLWASRELFGCAPSLIALDDVLICADDTETVRMRVPHERGD